MIIFLGLKIFKFTTFDTTDIAFGFETVTLTVETPAEPVGTKNKVG